MRTLIIIPVLLLSLFLGASSYSADFNKGLTAAQNGDWATALKEWNPLAKEGNAPAQYNLGLMNATGEGVIQDYVKAYMWWNIVASNGDDNGRKNRDIIAKQMTPSQIKKAQRLARECVAKNYKGC